VCFNGGVDVQGTLVRGTPEDVYGEKGRGGMIADNYGHWPAGIPPENIAAWQETVAAWPVGAVLSKVL
jgi:hypothetical protein